MPRPLAIIQRGTIGDAGDLLTRGVGSLLTDVQASARAQLYQELANFQAVPARLNRVGVQLGALEQATPARTLDESTRLTLFRGTLADLQQQWTSTNTAVTNTIANASSNGASVGVLGDAATALAGMTLVESLTAGLEHDVQGAIASATTLDPATRQQLLALGGPSSQLFTVLKWGAFSVIGYGVIKMLMRPRRRGTGGGRRGRR